MRPTLRLIANRDSLITLIIKKKKKKLKKKNYKMKLIYLFLFIAVIHSESEVDQLINKLIDGLAKTIPALKKALDSSPAS